MHSTASTRENDPRLCPSLQTALQQLDYETLACPDAQDTLDYLHRHNSFEAAAPWSREIWLWRHRDELIVPETMGDKSSSERRYALQLKHPPKVKGEGEPGEVGSGEVEFGGAKWRTADLKLDAQRQDKKYGGFWKARRPGGEDKDDANGIAPEQIAPPRVVESTESDEENE